MNNSTTTRAEMCADLARAMGWTVANICPSHPYEVCWFSPDGEMQHADDPPDPFTYAEHNRELVAWLAADAKLSERFNTILTKNIARYGFPLTPLEALTAPLETISLAAWRAIQE